MRLTVGPLEIFAVTLRYVQILFYYQKEGNKTKETPWPLVRERTTPTERPPLVDEI
jgi:hypothetical protein